MRIEGSFVLRRTSKPNCSFWAIAYLRKHGVFQRERRVRGLSAAPCIMISWFIAVRMLRLGRKFLARSSAQGRIRSAGSEYVFSWVRRTVEVIVATGQICVQRVEVCAKHDAQHYGMFQMVWVRNSLQVSWTQYRIDLSSAHDSHALSIESARSGGGGRGGRGRTVSKVLPTGVRCIEIAL